MPSTLKVVSVVLATSGGIQLSAHFLPFHLGTGGVRQGPAMPTPFEDWNVAIAAGLLVLAVGIWRRRSWAWWAGFLVLGLSWVGFLVASGLPPCIKILTARVTVFGHQCRFDG